MELILFISVCVILFCVFILGTKQLSDVTREQKMLTKKELQEKEIKEAVERALLLFNNAVIEDFFSIEQLADRYICRWNPNPQLGVLRIGVFVIGNNLCHWVQFPNEEIVNPAYCNDATIELHVLYDKWCDKSCVKRIELPKGIVCVSKFKYRGHGYTGIVPEAGEEITTIFTSAEDIIFCTSELQRADAERKAYFDGLEKKRIAEKIIEKQKKRMLEKDVRQKLIDDGILFGDETKRPPIPKEVVDAVYRRDKGRCVYCGSTEELQLDHIIPFSRGGATNIENLQLLCRSCNIKKSNKIG